MIHLGDITKISGYTAPPVEVVIGGSPCQDLSVAGKRAGLQGERSGLFMEQIRIIKEMRENDRRIRTDDHVRPRYMVWENVPGAFSSSKGEDFRAVLEETARIADENAVIPRPADGKWTTAGCIMADWGSIAWRVLDAQFFGVPQRRRRIALVADFGGHTAPEILFERESVSGDSQESGTQGQGTAADAERSVGAAIQCGNPWDSQTERVYVGDGAWHSLNSNSSGGQSRDAICYSFDSLASNSMKSSNPHSGCREVECSKTLDCFDPNPSKNQGGIAVVQPVLCLNDQGGSVMSMSEDVSGTLRAQEHGHKPCVVYNKETITSKTNASNPMVGDPCHTLGATGAGRTICIQGNCIDRADTAGCNGRGWRDDDVSYTLNTIDRPAVYALDQQGGKGGANYAENVCPSILSDSHGTPHAVYDARGNGDGNTAPTLTGDHQNRVTDYTAVCVGNGQLDQLKISEKVGALNCMHDQQAVMVSVVDCRNSTENPKTNGTLQAKSNGGMSLNLQNTVRVQNLVRRLTPLEAERLQGYPDGWTDLGEWTDSRGKVHQTSDSARYKALGNSIALPPWRFVLGRLNAYLTEHTMASLFDGIGGFQLIWQELNGPGKCLWASEIEEFPIAVTKRRFEE